jgi:hypothetical protein
VLSADPGRARGPMSSYVRTYVPAGAALGAVGRRVVAMRRALSACRRGPRARASLQTETRHRGVSFPSRSSIELDKRVVKKFR